MYVKNQEKKGEHCWRNSNCEGSLLCGDNSGWVMSQDPNNETNIGGATAGVCIECGLTGDSDLSNSCSQNYNSRWLCDKNGTNKCIDNPESCRNKTYENETICKEKCKIPSKSIDCIESKIITGKYECPLTSNNKFYEYIGECNRECESTEVIGKCSKDVSEQYKCVQKRTKRWKQRDVEVKSTNEIKNPDNLEQGRGARAAAFHGKIFNSKEKCDSGCSGSDSECIKVSSLSCRYLLHNDKAADNYKCTPQKQYSDWCERNHQCPSWHGQIENKPWICKPESKSQDDSDFNEFDYNHYSDKSECDNNCNNSGYKCTLGYGYCAGIAGTKKCRFRDKTVGAWDECGDPAECSRGHCWPDPLKGVGDVTHPLYSPKDGQIGLALTHARTCHLKGNGEICKNDSDCNSDVCMGGVCQECEPKNSLWHPDRDKDPSDRGCSSDEFCESAIFSKNYLKCTEKIKTGQRHEDLEIGGPHDNHKCKDDESIGGVCGGVNSVSNNDKCGGNHQCKNDNTHHCAPWHDMGEVIDVLKKI